MDYTSLSSNLISMTWDWHFIKLQQLWHILPHSRDKVSQYNNPNWGDHNKTDQIRYISCTPNITQPPVYKPQSNWSWLIRTLSVRPICDITMTSSNGNIFCVTGLSCGEFTSHRWIPCAQRPLARSFDVFFDMRLNKQLSKQSWSWWFGTTSHPLRRQCNVTGCNKLD